VVYSSWYAGRGDAIALELLSKFGLAVFIGESRDLLLLVVRNIALEDIE